MMPLVRTAQRRLQVGAVLDGLAVGLVAIAVTTLVAGTLWQSPRAGVASGLVAAVLLSAFVVRRGAPSRTPLAAARAIEARHTGLDNLIVTATALHVGETAATDRMRAEVERQAAARAAGVRLSETIPLTRSGLFALLAAAGSGAVVWSAVAGHPEAAPVADHRVAAVPIQSVRVTVSPPPYLAAPDQTWENPEAVSLPAGSRLRLDVGASVARVWVEEPAGTPRVLTPGNEGRFVAEWVPDVTTTLVVAAGPDTGVAEQSRVLQMIVVPDEAPRVRVVQPGKDLAVATTAPVVEVLIEASDAERLDAMRLAYVRMSGSGESFAFEEGTWPIAIEHVSAREWRGRARLPLAALALEDGDSLVYRALVRDSNPDGEWASSDAFTIDVGGRLESGGAGFAIPDEDRRYAVSQQMVIVKTERMVADRAKLSPAQWTEDTQGLAVEQRMVRAEVVFLSGGEVQDEVEEAEHSHELQEGRLENAGRAEMLRAINEMSRAEARLNAGDASGALVFERAALAALQRAFDRRRYFLRTLSERSRIDPTRRLTGNLAGAQSTTRPGAGHQEDDVAVGIRALIGELAVVAETGGPVAAPLVARLAASGVGTGWALLAGQLAAASTPEARQRVAITAMAALAAHGRTLARPSDDRPPANELQGWWREEMRPGRRP